MPLANRHYPSLDGLRGIAILWVFLLHYAGGSRSTHFIVRLVGDITRAGAFGVDLFFALSGFLITGILLGAKNDDRYYVTFYARRTLRIVPVYYGVLILLLLFTSPLQIHWQVGHILFFLYLGNLAVSMQPSLATLGPYILIGHFWSLAVEEQFYAVWPWLIRRSKSEKSLLLVFAMCITFALVFRWAVGHTTTQFSLLYYQLPACMDRLALGGIVAVGIRNYRITEMSKQIPFSLFVASTSAAVICYSRQLAVVTILPLFIGISAGSLIWMALWDDTAYTRLLSSAALRILGKYSYGLYIYHQLLKRPLDLVRDYMMASWPSTSLAGACYVLLALSINLTLAIASYHLFEEPLLRMKRKFPYNARQEVCVVTNQVL